MESGKLIALITQQRIAILGLLLILVANSFHFSLLKVQIDGVLANVGALFLFVGTVEWLFDEKARRELIYEIFRSIRGDDNMHRSGLTDCMIHSRTLLEPEEWVQAKTLTVGIHYSPRFVEDHLDIIKERIKSKKKTVICHVAFPTAASNYLTESESGCSEIKSSLEKLKTLVRDEFHNSQYVELIEHDRVLRYMFIYTELGIWIKFFTNSKGRAKVPAIKIASSTPLFLFFEKDIRDLGAIK
jgi:hypothetical protein